MNVRQVVPRDAIPSVDDPEFRDTDDGDPDDEVVVVEADPPRAYPTRLLNYHEIVNDRVAGGDHPAEGRPIAATWCPLCGSAVVYDRRVDGRTLSFGVSGKLADDDLVMYDRETGTEWKQSTGEAIDGELAGRKLEALPAAVTTWRGFREAHPEGVVLAPPGGESEASGDGDDPEPIEYDDEPYRRYFESEGFGLAAHRGEGGREWDRDDLAPKDVVLGVQRGGDAVGFPMDRVEDAGGVVSAPVGDGRVLVVTTPEGFFAYEDPGYDFEPAGEGAVRGGGTRWDGATGEGDDGRRLGRVPARRLFAFAWQDDHGPGAFYG